MKRSLPTTHARFVAKCRWIEDLVYRGKQLDYSFQILVGELSILYLAISLEQCLQEVCSKICCGTSYMDGRRPKLLLTCRSISDAEYQMRHYSRPRNSQLRYTKWLNSGDLENNMSKILDGIDPLYPTLATHTATLDRIRTIRNHVAHRSRSTHVAYQRLIRAAYGPTSKAVAPGSYLMSERRSPRAPILTLLAEARILVKELVRA
jgi:hypothetical protein